MKRVIILGAGASCEMGYPLGSKLLEDLRNFYDEYMKLPSPERDQNCFLCGTYTFVNFVEDVSKICDDLKSTNISSIDTYVSRITNENNRIIIKCLIITLLLKARADNDGKQTGWYGNLIPLFFDSLKIHDSDGEKIEKIKERLKFVDIITFNYDTSLEDYLTSFLEKTYGLENQSIKQQIFQKIHHVYGSILPVVEDAYHNSIQNILQKNNLMKVASAIFARSEGDGDLKLYDSIKVIREKEQTKIATKIQEILKCDHDVLYVLGFGFDQDNIDLIGLKNANWQKGCFVTNNARNEKPITSSKAGGLIMNR